MACDAGLARGGHGWQSSSSPTQVGHGIRAEVASPSPITEILSPCLNLKLRWDRGIDAGR